MPDKKPIFFALFLLLLPLTCQGGQCFTAADETGILIQEGDCLTRRAPGSTFKIALALMGFDSGILIDEKPPTWGPKPASALWLEIWKQPHNPTTWLANSCVWYSQVFTQMLGKDQFDNYVKTFAYGNQDSRGDPGQNNGLTQCWLSSSLAISPQEQIEFLTRLAKKQLPVSQKAQQKTINVMFLETLPNGWKLYGKTGLARPRDKKGQKQMDKEIGWFVGWVEKKEKLIAFASLIVGDKIEGRHASVRAKEAAKKQLAKILKNGAYA